VLSQRFSAKTLAEPFEVYRELRALNPSPYLFYLQLNDVSIVGSSPESSSKFRTRCFLPAHRRQPVGRGKDEAEDQRPTRNAGQRKRARRHIMLVDLGRNDLGRVCDYGTVKPKNCSPSSAIRTSCIWFPACVAACAKMWTVSTR